MLRASRVSIKRARLFTAYCLDVNERTKWSLYVVRTRDGQLYTGVATDVPRRLDEHRAENGRGAKYLRGRGPLTLAYEIAVGPRELALRVESRLKRRPREEKERVVAMAPPLAKLLTLLELE